MYGKFLSAAANYATKNASNIEIKRTKLITRAWKATSLKMRICFFSVKVCKHWLVEEQYVWRRVATQIVRRGRVVRALDSRPESPEFGSHSQQFEIQGHAL